MNIVDFIRTRLDEHEQAARAATSGPWRWEGDVVEGVADEAGWHESTLRSPVGDVLEVTGEHTTGYLRLGTADAAHIARHDPARVLAEVEAKRQLLALFDTEMWSDPVTATDRARRADAEMALCFLALPYHDHPDHDESWRPA